MNTMNFSKPLSTGDLFSTYIIGRWRVFSTVSGIVSAL